MLMFGHKKSAKSLNSACSKGEAQILAEFGTRSLEDFSIFHDRRVSAKIMWILLVPGYYPFSGSSSLREGQIFRIFKSRRLPPPGRPCSRRCRSAPGALRGPSWGTLAPASQGLPPPPGAYGPRGWGEPSFALIGVSFLSFLSPLFFFLSPSSFSFPPFLLSFLFLPSPLFAPYPHLGNKPWDQHLRIPMKVHGVPRALQRNPREVH